MWSRVPVHSDHWEEGAHAEALGGSRMTSTELCALLHLPPRVGTRGSMHLHPISQTETLFYNSEPRSRLSQKAVRPLHTEVGGPRSSGEPGRARGKQVMGPQ